jgi:hypothetical protein
MEEWTRRAFDQNAHALLEALHHDNDNDNNNNNAVIQAQEEDDDTAFVLCHWQLQSGNDDDDSDLYLWHPPITTYEYDDDDDSCNDDDALWLLEDSSIPFDPQQYTTESSQMTKNTNTNNESQEQQRQRQPIQWAFSIVYSDTYRVPVLYFHVQQLMKNGAPCTRSHVVEWLLPSNIDDDDDDDDDRKGQPQDTWEFISQQEHPCTGVPSYFLHPCQTAQRMKMLNSSTTTTSDNNTALLWTWMSMILPAVSQSIPGSYFLRIQTAMAKKQRGMKE